MVQRRKMSHALLGGGGRTTHSIKSANDSQESNSPHSQITNSHNAPHSKTPHASHTPLTSNFLTPQQAKEIIESQKAKITHTPHNRTLEEVKEYFFRPRDESKL